MSLLLLFRPRSAGAGTTLSGADLAPSDGLVTVLMATDVRVDLVTLTPSDQVVTVLAAGDRLLIVAP